MIAAEFDTTAASGRIVMRPNRSWSWRANLYLLGTLMVVSGGVGMVLALLGLWPVLPFTVVEGLVLLGCLYYCVRRTHTQEVLTFSPDYLLFESGIGRPRTRRLFQRYFTRVFVRPPSHPWHRQRIALCCRGQELEIGSFLTSEEKEDLITALREMIHRLESLPPASRPRQ